MWKTIYSFISCLDPKVKIVQVWFLRNAPYSSGVPFLYNLPCEEYIPDKEMYIELTVQRDDLLLSFLFTMAGEIIKPR